jgi:hypothetical protein
MIKTFAVQITPENSTDIVAFAAKWHLNVDYLDAEMEDAEHYGFDSAYAIMSFNFEYKHATFTTMVDEDFEGCWHFASDETYGPFRHIELNNPKAQ